MIQVRFSPVTQTYFVLMGNGKIADRTIVSIDGMSFLNSKKELKAILKSKNLVIKNSDVIPV